MTRQPPGGPGHTDPRRASARPARADRSQCPVAPSRPRPGYARVLGLRHLKPGSVLCFLFFEGTLILATLLALAELVSWWGVLLLPASVALLVKVNDLVATVLARSAFRVPTSEQERFRRELAPVVGRAAVPPSSLVVPTGAERSEAAPAESTDPLPVHPGQPLSPSVTGRNESPSGPATLRPSHPTGLDRIRVSVARTVILRSLVGGTDRLPLRADGRSCPELATTYRHRPVRPSNTLVTGGWAGRSNRYRPTGSDDASTVTQRSRQSSRQRY